MIKKLVKISLFSSLLVSVMFAKATPSLVDEYMDISGANISIESISTQVESGLKQSAMMQGEKVEMKILTFLKEAFSSEITIPVVRQSLIENFQDENLKKIIAYYKTPEARRVTQSTLDMLDKDRSTELLQFMANLQANPPSETRTNLIKNLNNELKPGKLSEVIFMDMVKYMSKAFLKDENAISEEQMAQMSSMINAQIEEQMYISSLFIYKDISDADLKQVLSFYKTKAGNREIEVMIDSMSKMVTEGFKTALENME